MPPHDVEEGTPPHQYQDGDPFDKSKYENLVDMLLPQNHWNHESDSCHDCCLVKFASERIHDLISEENSLVHNRITWFANIEGFLRLSFAAVISEKVGWDKGFALLICIPVIGILFV